MNFPSFKNLFRRETDHATLGLEIRPDGIAWALTSGSGQWQLGFEECTPARREQSLKNRIQALSPGPCQVRAVLPIEQYQVFQVERPPVEAAELATAIRWKIKDLLDFPISEAVVDVFDFPDAAVRGRGALVNAVVARKSLIADLVALVRSVDMELATVDVAELALSRLLVGLPAQLAQPDRSSALVYLRRQSGHMVICQGETLFLSRRVDVQLDHLSGAQTQEQALINLGLEVQRSLDYYESQLGQAPPRAIHFIGHADEFPLAGLLAGAMAAGVKTLPVADILGQAEIDPRCLYAAGAACSLGAAST